MEELEHAKARGAKIYAELVGYGATSDGADMVAPSGEGAVRCMKQALNEAGGHGHNAPIDYINTHGTSTPRSEEHTSELQSLMRISYAVFCLKKKKKSKTKKKSHSKNEQSNVQRKNTHKKTQIKSTRQQIPK